jgi:hypothetical protein
MNTKEHGSAANGRREARLEDLLGRVVLAANNRPVGRLEEFRAEMRGHTCVVVEYVIGVTGLIERFGLGFKLVLGMPTGGHVARWDQIDISDPHRPRLTCAVSELRTLS